MKTVRLIPKKPSELLKFGLASLLEVEREKEFTIVMKVWNAINPNTQKCHVCLAGAALMKAGFEKGQSLEGAIFNDDRFSRRQTKHEYVRRGLALNHFRKGRIRRGLHELGFKYHEIDLLGIIENVDMPHYDADRDGFIKGLEKIIKILKEAGV